MYSRLPYWDDVIGTQNQRTSCKVFVRVFFLKWASETLRRKVYELIPCRFILRRKNINGVEVLALCIYSLIKMQTELVYA